MWQHFFDVSVEAMKRDYGALGVHFDLWKGEACVDPLIAPMVEKMKAIGLADVGEGRTALLVHADDERLRRLAVLDAVINNADRKGGHLLPGGEGRLYGIDHGVTFNAENKLRTLLWGWAGEPLTGEAVEVLKGLKESLEEGAALALRLGELLTPAEVQATRARVAALLPSRCLRQARNANARPLPAVTGLRYAKAGRVKTETARLLGIRRALCTTS